MSAGLCARLLVVSLTLQQVRSGNAGEALKLFHGGNSSAHVKVKAEQTHAFCKVDPLTQRLKPTTPKPKPLEPLINPNPKLYIPNPAIKP